MKTTRKMLTRRERCTDYLFPGEDQAQQRRRHGYRRHYRGERRLVKASRADDMLALPALRSYLHAVRHRSRDVLRSGGRQIAISFKYQQIQSRSDFARQLPTVI